MSSIDNTAVSKHLGQTSSYASVYDPTLLVRELRQNNRSHLGLTEDNLPFVGYDTWNAWEVSGLTSNGTPVSVVAKIVYPCTSKYIVESKSLKLYLNSFNMTKMGKDPEQVYAMIEEYVSADLSRLLETTVKVRVHTPAVLSRVAQSSADSWGTDLLFNTLEEVVNIYDADDITKYSESPELLQVVDSDARMPYFYHSGLLKSNCRVTSQPDWGDVYVFFRGAKTVTPESLLRYIISFRDECHFHEEICETIYTRLLTALQPEQLMVRCLYTRRGGIDINPERATKSDLLNWNLSKAEKPHIKTPKQ